MWKSSLLGLCLLLAQTHNAFAQNESLPNDSTSNSKTLSREIAQASKDIFGINPTDKFSLYQPSYLVVGEDNLKMQFSGKYRLANSYNLYLAYTQTMLWSIYENSAPFDDINYNPEVFYRIAEDDDNLIRSIDFGATHTSNGEDSGKSRSINRAFLKTNVVTQVGRHALAGILKFQHIYSKSDSNRDIVDYMGYWELKLILTHILIHNKQRLDFEYRFFAGKKIINFNKGGGELGLVYRLGSENFNPAFYLQYYYGYAESLLHYNQKTSQARIGLLLFY